MVDRSTPDAGVVVSVERDGKTYLGLNTHVGSRSIAVTQFTVDRSDVGYIVREGRCDPWKIEGFLQKHDVLFLYGPEFQGRDLKDILALPSDQAIPLLTRFLAALLSLPEGVRESLRYDLHSFRLADDGALLVLPPERMRLIRQSLPEAKRLGMFAFLDHPDLKGARLLSHVLGVLAYRSLTGISPYDADNETEIRIRIRNVHPIDPQLRNPSITTETSEFLMQALGWKGLRPSLAEWTLRLEAWGRNEHLRTVTDEERRRLEIQVEKAKKSEIARTRTRQFFQRSGRRILVGTGVAAATIWLLYMTLGGIFRPSPIRDLEPEQIVLTFYTGFNTLNSILMRECAVPGVGGSYVDEVDNMYIMKRMAIAQNTAGSIVTADFWDQTGRPAVEAPDYVYGITDLVIAPVSEDPLIYTVSYVKWNVDETLARNPSITTIYRAYRRVDSVHVIDENGLWQISSIENVRSDMLLDSEL